MTTLPADAGMLPEKRLGQELLDSRAALCLTRCAWTKRIFPIPF